MSYRNPGLRQPINDIWSIGIWDFSTISGKENGFFLIQLELTLTFSCLAIGCLTLTTNCTKKNNLGFPSCYKKINIKFKMLNN
jgi:hypothetical protein